MRTSTRDSCASMKRCGLVDRSRIAVGMLRASSRSENVTANESAGTREQDLHGEREPVIWRRGDASRVRRIIAMRSEENRLFADFRQLVEGKIDLRVCVRRHETDADELLARGTPGETTGFTNTPSSCMRLHMVMAVMRLPTYTGKMGLCELPRSKPSVSKPCFMRSVTCHKALHALGLVDHDIERGQRRAGVGRAHAGAEDQCARMVLEVVDVAASPAMKPPRLRATC